MHLTMIFVDGFGLGTVENNPVLMAETPHLDRLLGGQGLYGDRVLVNNNTYLFPLDATLDMPGIPQSATGQAALWTGVNTAKALGHHLNAYPNEQLANMIKAHSIFKQLADEGCSVAFANAFTESYEDIVAQGQRSHSASTLCALAGGVRLRLRNDLLDGKAVYQVITNEIFCQK